MNFRDDSPLGRQGEEAGTAVADEPAPPQGLSDIRYPVDLHIPNLPEASRTMLAVRMYMVAQDARAAAAGITGEADGNPARRLKGLGAMFEELGVRGTHTRTRRTLLGQDLAHHFHDRMQEQAHRSIEAEEGRSGGRGSTD